jgi:trimethylamine--corrinoid protein Co-methyltransferase
MMPHYEPLSPDLLTRIVGDALATLDSVGVVLHDPEAAGLLCDSGARMDASSGPRLFLPPALVERARATAPTVVSLFDAAGVRTHEIGGDAVYFVPGSSAPAILDRRTGEAVAAKTSDYVEYVKVVDGLPNLPAQSTAFIPDDVPAAASDSYRLYLSLLHSRKPVVTGTFSASGFPVMRDLLTIARGGPSALASAPLAIFTCCPTSPLAWSADATATLLGCARAGIPVEVVPMALAGFVSPVSLAGTLVQHTAEALVGVVLSQIANPGTPVLFGCASTAFDVRHETTPMASIESMLLACASAQIGRHLRLPTQAYSAVSDAKRSDAQSGAETAMGASLAALAGINSIAGPGLMDFGACFSLESLVLDDDVCGMALRARHGIGEPTAPPLEVIQELLREGHLLIATDTRRNLRREISMPSRSIDRASRARWNEDGRSTVASRTAERIAELLAGHEPPPWSRGVTGDLAARMLAAVQAAGARELPTPCVP